MIPLHLPFKMRRTRLTREGIVGLGLFALCVVFYLTALRPMQIRLDQLNASVVALREKLQSTATSLRARREIPAEQLVTYYRFFPSQTSAPVWLEKIYKAAREQNIPLEQGEYRANRDKDGKLARYRITLPVKGTYFQVRRFVAAVLTEVPIASLDQISFERQKIGDDALDAKIRLTLYLGQET